MKTLVRFSLILASLTVLSGCAGNIVGPRLPAIGVPINNSVELLNFWVSTRNPGDREMISAGNQGGAFELDIGVEVTIRWTMRDNRIYKEYRFTPDDILRPRSGLKDLYGVPVDFIVRANGNNSR